MFDLLPFEHRNNFSKYFDNFDRTLFSNMFDSFRTDILDKGDKFLLQAELPGYNKEDIHINIGNDRLTISAEHKEEKEQKDDNYVCRERNYGTFERSFDISNIEANNITAEYKNGVLEVALPKINEVKQNIKQIEVK